MTLDSSPRDGCMFAKLNRDEIANGISHAVGFVLSIVGSIVLLLVASLRNDGWRSAACSVYATTLIATYAISTMSHVVLAPGPRRFLRILDQATIFLLIAGSYTPFAFIHVDHGGWVVFALVWGVALAGFFCKVLSGEERLGVGSMLTYLLLGWIPGVALVPILYRAAFDGIGWLVAGGLCYSVGTIFLGLDRKIPYGHLLWHLFVIAGSGCHYAAILRYTELPN